MSDSLPPRGLYSPWNSPGQNTDVGSLSLLQGIFHTQGSNPGLPYCRWILDQLSHQGSPRILEWVAYPFSRASSWPRNRAWVSCIAGGFFTNWAVREAPQKGDAGAAWARNAGDTGFIPTPSRSHMPWSNWKCMWHSFRAHAREPTSHSCWACVLQLPKPVSLEPVLRSRESHCQEKPEHHGGVAPAQGNWRKPVRSSEDPVQQKTNDKWINKLLENNKKNLKWLEICTRNFSTGKAVCSLQLPDPLPPSLPTSFLLHEGPLGACLSQCSCTSGFIHSLCEYLFFDHR